MQCSLYGKLPTKRDFIAIGSPRAFLDVWEPWLQGGVSASRTKLGEQWQDAFLTAPIWRFWLGADLCGRPVIGAFMPSLDGVGRYFPLTLFSVADEGETIPPPELDAQETWFGAVEELLMAALDSEKTFDDIVAALGALATPNGAFPAEPGQTMLCSSGATIAALARDQTFGDVFGAIRRTGDVGIHAGMSYWWTIGGEGFAPMVLCDKGMPDPFLFSAMLTGQFAPVEN